VAADRSFGEGIVLPDNDIRELEHRAVERSVEIVSRRRFEDLDRPTPCEGWTASDLLAHLTVQHHGFAATAEGRGADPTAWRVTAAADRPSTAEESVSRYLRAAERVTTVFAAADVVADRFALAGFSADAVSPAMQANGFHFIDHLVHGWDAHVTARPRPADLVAPRACLMSLSQSCPLRTARGLNGFGPWMEGR